MDFLEIKMNSSSDSETDLPPDSIKDEAKEVVENLLPQISKERYMQSYNYFMKWRAEKNVQCFSEGVFLTYFSELSEKLQPSTLWSIFSMLNTTLNTKHDINLKNYTKLTSFLKKQSVGFKCKKTKVFTAEEVETFLKLAPDEIYLATKVALIFGINGACRTIELTNMTVENVEKHDQLILVKLPNKTKIDRTFVVREELAQIVQRYQDLRPDKMQTNRFFLNYQQGKCLRQVIGKNKICSMPKQIATYLNLPNPHLYSGHCFRRTSATLLAKSGADLTMLWKSSKVDDGNIEESVEEKYKIADTTLHSIQYSPRPGSSKDSDVCQKLIKEEVDIPDEDNQPMFSSTDEIMPSPTITDVQATQISQKISNVNIPGKNMSISFTNCSNLTINFK